MKRPNVTSPWERIGNYDNKVAADIAYKVAAAELPYKAHLMLTKDGKMIRGVVQDRRRGTDKRLPRRGQREALALHPSGGSEGVLVGPSTESRRTPIEALGLSVRAYSCLRRAGIETVEEVAGKSETELLQIRNLGPKTASELAEALSRVGTGS